MPFADAITVGLPKRRAKRDLLLRLDLLVAEEDHEMLEEGLLDLVELPRW